MSGASIQADLEDDYETELSRLGSSKALYALTGGEMETDAVLAALAGRAAAAAETFEGWAASAADEHGAGAFAAAAEMADEHAQALAAEAGTDATGNVETAVGSALEAADGPDARLGGLLAWLLVTDRTLAQAVGFFVGNADPQAADRFRDLRDDVETRRADVAERLEDADRGSAAEAAGAVVEAAYDDYVETLEGLGVKVKPVC